MVRNNTKKQYIESAILFRFSFSYLLSESMSYFCEKDDFKIGFASTYKEIDNMKNIHEIKTSVF